MIALLTPWILLGLGLGAIFSTQSLENAGYVIGVLLIGPLLERLLPLENSRRIGGLTGVTLALVLPIPVIDRLALVVAVATCQAFPYSIHRPMVASMGLMVTAGPKSIDYVYYSLAFVYTMVLAFWLHERRHGKAPKRRLALYLIASFVIGLSTCSLLPKAHRWLVEWSIGADIMKRAGFGVVTDLRGITSIQTSSAVTLRMWASGPRLLRGQVYSTYGNGMWNVSGSAPFTYLSNFEEEAKLPIRQGNVEIVKRLWTRSRFVFLPRNSTPLAVPNCRIETNRHGTVFSTTNPVMEYAFNLGSRKKSETTTPGDYLYVPKKIKPSFKKIALAWTEGAKSNKEKVFAISARLNSRYSYSLEPHTPTRDKDPVLWFLEKRKEGHCELFASALVLLVRSLGIPARYVSGYSVSTRNPMTDYYVGRNCDAHAWAEVWLPNESWIDVDATPPDWRGAQTSRLALYLRHFSDWLNYWISDKVANIRAAINEALENTSESSTTLFALVSGTLIMMLLLWRMRDSLSHLFSTIFIRTNRAKVSSTDVQKAFLRLETLFSEQGTIRKKSATAAEYASYINQSGVGSETKELVNEFVTLFSRARYGQEKWDQEKGEQLLATIKEHIKNAQR